MDDYREEDVTNNETRITVTSTSISGIVDALEVEIAEKQASPDLPSELYPVFTAIEDIFEGVKLATQDDSRGRSRKIVMELADRSDLSSDVIGHHLRVLEAHDLIIQDGNRWRVDEPDSDR